MFDSNNSEEKCVICLEQKKRPTILGCGHSFCSECLETYITYRKICSKCPICRRKILRKKSRKSLNWVGFVYFTVGIALIIIFFQQL